VKVPYTNLPLLRIAAILASFPDGIISPANTALI